MNKAFLSGVAAVAALGISTASAVELDGKKGIGAAAGIGGVQGLAFNYGTGNLAVEGLLNAKMGLPKEGDSTTDINLGLGAHFMALRADKAAFSVGGRLSFGLPNEGDTTIGLDIPTRVYWFADEHVSFHFESGIRVANVTGDDKEIGLFDSTQTVGATFWW